MSLQLDYQELIGAALLERFADRLGDGIDVRLGWAGSKPFPEGDGSAVLAVQVMSPREDFSASIVKGFSTPGDDEEAITDAKMDYGSAVADVVADLYVISRQKGRTLRSTWIRKVREAFDLEPGRPLLMMLTLANVEAGRVQVTLEEVKQEEEPEGPAKNEWRATIAMTARYALESTISLPYCREIGVGTEPDAMSPVDDILEGE